MSKYYIQSGKIRHIIDRIDHETAIRDTLNYYKESKIKIPYEKICISETGWKNKLECYDIKNFIK